MENVKKILETNIVGTLATLNEDGSPWATPLHVFADDTALYWFSHADHQHSLNVARDARVNLALWARNEGTLGAYISGTAVQLNDEETAKVLAIAEATLGSIPPFFNGTSTYKLPLGELNRGKSSEKRWYFYT